MVFFIPPQTPKKRQKKGRFFFINGFTVVFYQTKKIEKCKESIFLLLRLVTF
jgi:hypothetical protein